MSLDQRIPLLFDLGDVCDAQRLYVDAFEYYRQANALQPLTFLPPAYAAYIDRLIEVCNKAFFATAPRASNGSDRPLFIIGMPRAGTTLVKQILASHPQVCAASSDTRIVTDKMWVNYEYLGLISRLFPGACVIHCRRNPMDSVCRCTSKVSPLGSPVRVTLSTLAHSALAMSA